MKPTLIEASEALAATLARENAALAGLDLTAVADLYPDKDAATSAFIAAQAQAASSLAPALNAEQLRRLPELAERLWTLAEENRRLLKRAIEVQRHVVGTVARAIAQAAPRAQPPRYGASGTLAEARRQVPVMLSSRA